MNVYGFNEDQCHQHNAARRARLMEDMEAILAKLYTANEAGLSEAEVDGLRKEYERIEADLVDIDTRGW